MEKSPCSPDIRRPPSDSPNPVVIVPFVQNLAVVTWRAAYSKTFRPYDLDSTLRQRDFPEINRLFRGEISKNAERFAFSGWAGDHSHRSVILLVVTLQVGGSRFD
jgi:hypothetical protein